MTHDMPFGATFLDSGGVRFRLWAPDCERVQLELDEGAAARRLPMQPLADGWHERVEPTAGAGTRYRFVVSDGLVVPDPASRWNPDDVHGASAVTDPAAHAWQDAAWPGRPWHEAVIYELHVGSFTPQGNYLAAAERLSELAALGITAIELMPVADFPGQRGWGYDGVLPFAPDSSYGTPDELKQLIDAAHGHGLMVLLDVVYNHFGPEGNYLHAYCPSFFNPAHQTPWGSAINFDGERSRTVRDYFVHNALYWIEEFHFDGLRLDAVQAIRDGSPQHIACEIGRALRDGPGRRRHVHLVLENLANETRRLERDPRGAVRCADAQWNDDLHHAAHVLVTGETDGYYADFADEPLARFGRTLAEGFDDELSALPGRVRGAPSANLPSQAFVSFLQNHDQIGNRAFGERLHRLVKNSDGAALEALYACLLLSPHVPMLFMGEEFAASTPFLFFCDFGPELAEAVATGRREEFKHFPLFADESARERIPDPNALATFTACKLRWEERSASPHRERLALLERLLSLRHRWLVPRLAHQRRGGRHRVDGDVLHVDWPLGDGSTWRMAANFGTAAAGVASAGQTVYAHAVADAQLLPGGVLVTLETAND
jgi:maltooligosyltrehalose trehalohydrolase